MSGWYKPLVPWQPLISLDCCPGNLGHAWGVGISVSLSWGICLAWLGGEAGGSLGLAAWAGFPRPQLLPALTWAARPARYSCRSCLLTHQLSCVAQGPGVRFWSPKFLSCTYQCQEWLQQSRLGFPTRTGPSPVALSSAGPPVVTVARLGAPGAVSCLSERGSLGASLLLAP